MSRPVNIAMPCAGNAFAMGPRSDYRIACWVCERYQDNGGTCTGPDGWPLMAHTAAEVARERAPKPPGGTVTNVTLYPGGIDTRLVQDEERWTS